MNLTKAEKVRLGVFLSTGATLLVGSSLILAGLKVLERSTEYVVSFTENVSGLEPSAAVKYQGLRVGVVSRIRIDPTDTDKIEVHLSLQPEIALHQGTKAVLETSLLTGFKTVNLIPGDEKMPRIEPGGRIPAEDSLFAHISDRAEEISKRIERVAINLDQFTSETNRVRMEGLIEHTDKLVTDVDVFVVDVKDPLVNALEEVAKTSASVRTVTDEANATLKEVRAEVAATLQLARETIADLQKAVRAVDPKLVNEILISANAAVRGFEKNMAAEDLGALFADLRTALANLTRLMQSLDLTVRASRDDLVMSLKHLRQAAQDIRDFSRIIAQDPSVLLRGTEAKE